MQVGIELDERHEQAATWALLASMLAASLTILYLGRDLAFYSDELGWLTFGSGFSPEVLLSPHNGHLIALPRAVYELLPQIFGPEYLPFQLLALGAFLASVGAFFTLARRRIGGPLSLLPSVVLLFFGSASVIVLSPLAIPFTFSIAFGLWALVALEAGRRRDPLVALLLVLSLLSHSFGGLICVGAALYLLRERDWKRRLWSVALPLALYAIWWIWAQKFDQGIASLSNAGEVPRFVVESLIATLAAITGFAGPTLGDRFHGLADVAEVVFVAAALGALLLLALRMRQRQPGSWLLPYAVILLLFWVGLGFSEGPAREPTTPRYLFFGSIMLILVAVALARGVRPTRSALIVLLGFFVVSLVLNIARLERSADANTRIAAEVRAQLGAIELAGPSVDPGFSPRLAGPPGSREVGVPAGRYLAFVDQVGPIGYSPAELAAQNPATLAGADFVLARSQGLLAASDDSLEDGACSRYPGSEAWPARFELGPGATSMRLRGRGGPPQPLLLGRLAPDPGVRVGELEPGVPARIEIPPDQAPGPWLAEVAASVRVCEEPGG